LVLHFFFALLSSFFFTFLISSNLFSSYFLLPLFAILLFCIASFPT
jgi:hypothetical protein